VLQPEEVFEIVFKDTPEVEQNAANVELELQYWENEGEPKRININNKKYFIVNYCIITFCALSDVLNKYMPLGQDEVLIIPLKFDNMSLPFKLYTLTSL